jgi:hypothetical protein
MEFERDGVSKIRGALIIIAVDMWVENNTVEGTSLAIWKCCNIIVNPAKKIYI